MRRVYWAVTLVMATLAFAFATVRLFTPVTADHYVALVGATALSQITLGVAFMAGVTVLRRVAQPDTVWIMWVIAIANFLPGVINLV